VLDGESDWDSDLAVLFDLRQPLAYQSCVDWLLEGYSVGKRSPQVSLNAWANPDNEASQRISLPHPDQQGSPERERFGQEESESADPDTLCLAGKPLCQGPSGARRSA
jgi:hypothetical protein